MKLLSYVRVLAGLFLGFQAVAVGAGQPESGVYLGLKVGEMQFSNRVEHYRFSNGVKDDLTVRDDTGYGLIAGYQFANGFAVEAEHTATETDTQAVYMDCCLRGGTVEGRSDVDFDTYAIYGVYRTRGDIYVKAKVGYLYEEVRYSTAAWGSRDTNYHDSWSAGIGIGFRFGAVSAEVEYSGLGEDVGFTSLGLIYTF